jgi:hypothetical protein
MCINRYDCPTAGAAFALCPMDDTKRSSRVSLSSTSLLSPCDKVIQTNVLNGMINEYLTIDDLHNWRQVNHYIRRFVTSYVRAPMKTGSVYGHGNGNGSGNGNGMAAKIWQRISTMNGTDSFTSMLSSPLQQLLLECGNDGAYISGSLALGMLTNASWLHSLSDIDIFVKGSARSLAAIGRLLLTLQTIEQLHIDRISFQSSLQTSPPPPPTVHLSSDSNGDGKQATDDVGGSSHIVMDNDSDNEQRCSKRARVSRTSTRDDGKGEVKLNDHDTNAPSQAHQWRCICGSGEEFWCNDPSHLITGFGHNLSHFQVDLVGSILGQYWSQPNDNNNTSISHERLHYLTGLFPTQLRRHATARAVAARAARVSSQKDQHNHYDKDDDNRYELPVVTDLPEYHAACHHLTYDESLDIEVSRYTKHMRSCYYAIELSRHAIPHGHQTVKEATKFKLDIIVIAGDDCALNGGLWGWIARNFDM